MSETRMKTCDKPATHRYTWPGRDEALVCHEHAGGLRLLADTMGLHLQLIPVSEGECEQKVSG